MFSRADNWPKTYSRSPLGECVLYARDGRFLVAQIDNASGAETCTKRGRHMILDEETAAKAQSVEEHSD